MTPYRWTMTAVLMVALCIYGTGPVAANNLRIANATLIAPATPDGTAQIRFDISWENSWRYAKDADDKYYHDAAWVFFKVRPTNGDWQHVVLEAAGHTTGDAEGTPIEISVPTDRMGAFIRRSEEGAGTLARTNVTVKWNLADSGISASRSVEIRACGIEMVYVAEGAFWVGDGASGFVSATRINTANATNPPVLIGGIQYQGGYPALSGNTVTLRPSTNAWPNGYNAFYCAKYLVTQGQYADFLNTLTKIQSEHRDPRWDWFTLYPYRLKLSGGWPNFVADRPDRAHQYTSWADQSAFLAWSALRPISETEYEKACRGQETYVTNEFAWGATTIVAIVSLNIVGAENGTETVSNDVTMGAAVYGNQGFTGNADAPTGWQGMGPLRVGIFATNGATRVSAGAGFWGIMELSGSLDQGTVDLGHASGRKFSGLHGTGALNGYGEAPVLDLAWPDYDGNGVRLRSGGNSLTTTPRLRVSDRTTAGTETWIGTANHRHPLRGVRGVRTAP